MTISTDDQEIIREYLLGRLAQDEQQKLEERLMLEDDLFDEFEVSKGELVEQYCAGELGKTERAWFERHYLASPEGKEKFTLALALNSVKRDAHVPAPAPVVLPQPTFFERITSLFSQQRWAVASVSSVVLVAICVSVWQLSSSGPTVVGPTLISKAINRESGDLPAPVTLPSDAAALKLRLLLPQPSAAGVRYQAELDRKTDEKAVEVVEFDTQSVSVVIPASDLPPGEYALTLTMIKPDGTQEKVPGQYLFNVD